MRASRLTIALAAGALLAAPAHAHLVPCGDGDRLIAHLEKVYGEDPAVIALDADSAMVRILVNPESGTWSMLITRAGELTCLVHDGTAWEPIAPPADPGDPS